MTAAATVAYCGLPPTPTDLAGAWNLDPVLLAGLGVVAWLIARHASRPGLAWAAWGLAVAVFVSPLCNLTSALFAARVLHHVVLTAAIAPLLVAGFGMSAAVLRVMGGGSVVAALAHAGAMWLWHAPGPYGWALETVAGYWLMQATLLGTAVWLWAVILGDRPSDAVAAAAGSFMQMGLLGALIVFAANPLYAAHLFTTAPWGLDPLDDQRLGGLLMWVPAAGPYMAAVILCVVRLLADGAAESEPDLMVRSAGDRPA